MGRLKKRLKLVLGMFLVVAFGVAKSSTNHIFAEENNSRQYEINLGCWLQQEEADRWNIETGKIVYYGTYEGKAMGYRVLGSSVETQETIEECILLDSDMILYRSIFSDFTSLWSESDLRSDLNGKVNMFSQIEVKAMANTQLLPADMYYTGYGLFEDTGSNDKLFVLSAAEAFELYEDNESRVKTGEYGCWWLRSENTEFSGITGFVVSGDIWPELGMGDLSSYFPNGSIYSANVDTDYIGVSPAFNLKKESVLFTIACVGGVGWDKTQSLANACIKESDSREWKLTLIDEKKEIKLSNVDAVTKNGETIIVPYTYSDQSEENKVNQISIMITDSEYTDSDSRILYYGALDNIGNELIVDFELPSDLPNEYRVYLIAECINEGCYTDYASLPLDITEQVYFSEVDDKEITSTSTIIPKTESKSKRIDYAIWISLIAGSVVILLKCNNINSNKENKRL